MQRSPMNAKHRSELLWLALMLLPGAGLPAVGQPVPALNLTVTSAQDNVQADEGLTLREAIQLLNGTLDLEQLSATERTQVEVLAPGADPRIEFKLPPDQTTIQLTGLLPALERPGTVIDGTTQPGYRVDRPVINELPIVAPIVTLTPAAGVEVFRGLTIAADRVVVRGLSLYGFTSSHRATASTPPADIFIAHPLAPPNTQKQQPPANFSPFYSDDRPPNNVIIEQNWLGFAPTDVALKLSPQAATNPVMVNRSAFGVSVFNAENTVIRRNWIADHDGSGIITSVRAIGLQVRENVITGNGLAGMPDAVRLEGDVAQAQIRSNLICGNDGSGIYLFKPTGAVQIQDNQIIYNGRRLRRSAIYLMGSDHRVSGNQIRYQTGPGVVVAAYPSSTRNQIVQNRFSGLEGLSIDLVTLQGSNGTNPQDYQRGDGANPQRNSPHRRQSTGNGAIDAPQFSQRQFTVIEQAGVASPAPATPLLGTAAPPSATEVSGVADPNTQIELYQVEARGQDFGPLTEPIATVSADSTGKFATILPNLRPGTQLSAIATDPVYGTSEPARNVILGSATAAQTSRLAQGPSSIPRCVTAFAEATPPPQEEPPTPLRIRVPQNIHFALDQATISSATAVVLDQIAQVLLGHPSLLVEIQGHTDPRASDAYNLELGRRRALAARDYLLRKGVGPERMTIRSFGEQRPISPGRTRLDYARDRRVEFIYKDARDIDIILQEADLQPEFSGGRR